MSSTTPPSSRAPLWFCYQCHAEMRPLMIPDPHCASCNSDFVEQMDGTGEDDPREFARENEAAEMAHNAFFNALFNLSAPGAPGSPSGRSGASNSPTPGTPTRTSRAPRSGLRVEVVSSGANGSPHRRTITFGAAPRDRDRTETAGPGIGANYQTDLPDFVQQRWGSVPTGPAENEIETPFGPRRAGIFHLHPGGPQPTDDPRAMLMQYIMGMLSGQFGPDGDDHEWGGGMPGSGAFGDYVFSQEGLDRIVTQLMEAAAQQHKPNPAPEEMIAGLPRTKLTFDCGLVKSGQSCAICTEYFAPSDASVSANPNPDENTSAGSGVAITLPCAHSFHDDCITTWLQSSGTCPVCRYALVEQPTHGAAPEHAPNGAAASSSGPPNPAPSQNTEERPPSPTSPQGQAHTFFNAVGGPNALLQSLFGPPSAGLRDPNGNNQRPGGPRTRSSRSNNREDNTRSDHWTDID